MATALLLTDIVIQFYICRILSIFRYKDHSLQSAIIKLLCTPFIAGRSLDTRGLDLEKSRLS